eukprot:SAG25_NODE_8299_length_429_cov_0.778788_1_plen_82_part_01
MPVSLIRSESNYDWKRCRDDFRTCRTLLASCWSQEAVIALLTSSVTMLAQSKLELPIHTIRAFIFLPLVFHFLLKRLSLLVR